MMAINIRDNSYYLGLDNSNALYRDAYTVESVSVPKYSTLAYFLILSISLSYSKYTPVYSNVPN